MLILVLLIFSIAFYEFSNMFRIGHRLLFTIFLIAGLVSIVLFYMVYTGNLDTKVLMLAFITFSLLLLSYYLISSKIKIGKIGLILFAWLWIIISLNSFIALGWMDNRINYHPESMIIILSLIWINDVSAYVFGSLFGKNILAQKISPGKTWEGFLSGIVLTGLAGYIVYILTKENSFTFWIIIALAVSIGATIGDLIESKLKREAGVKDSGKLIPGHGGMLDRFDSLFFCAPLVYLIFLILN